MLRSRQCGIFQGDWFSPLAQTSLSMILSDMKADYIHVLPGGNKLNHVLYMDDLTNVN